MTTKILQEGRFLRLCVREGWEFCDRVNTSTVVTIAALTPQGELLLTEQFRVPLDTDVIELPAGLAGDEPGLEGESLESAAARELEEETGYRAGRWESLTHGPTSAGMSSAVNCSRHDRSRFARFHVQMATVSSIPPRLPDRAGPL